MSERVGVVGPDRPDRIELALDFGFARAAVVFLRGLPEAKYAVGVPARLADAIDRGIAGYWTDLAVRGTPEPADDPPRMLVDLDIETARAVADALIKAGLESRIDAGRYRVAGMPAAAAAKDEEAARYGRALDAIRLAGPVGASRG